LSPARDEMPERQRAAADEPLFSATLLQHFDREFRAAWAHERSVQLDEQDVAGGLKQFKEEVLALPGKLGAKGAIAANKRDSLAEAVHSGDGVAVIEACARDRVSLSREEVDEAFFDRVFQPHAGGIVVDDDPASASKLSPGMTLRFGPGVHQLSGLRSAEGEAFPPDVKLIGAGINSTLLRLKGDISARSEIERLVLQDLTLDCNNDYMFDLRRKPLTIDMRSVRLVRFDMGAGGSLAFGTNRGAVIRARDCEILGGFGRSPGSGNLLRGDAFVATFERCRFELVDLNSSSPSPGRITFTDCIFDKFLKDPSEARGATFVNATVLPLISWEEFHLHEPRSLSELSPGWGN